MTDPVVLRCQFLRDAAHVLAVSAPSASALLGAANNRLMQDAELDLPTKEKDSVRRETCGACGSLLIPGWSCQNSSTTQRRRHNESRTNAAREAATSVVYHCLRCNRRTEQRLQPKPVRQWKRAGSVRTPDVETNNTAPTKADDSKTPRTANASSKHRKKVRKGGLQALLEKNKHQASTAGLDLMDFAM